MLAQSIRLNLSGIGNETELIQRAVDLAGDGGEVTFPPGVFRVLGLRVPSGVTLMGRGTIFKTPKMESGDGDPVAWVTGPSVTFDGITFDGCRGIQPQDGYSDSVDGGGSIKAGRSYRCAIRADAESGVPGQVPPEFLTVRNCRFTELYGAGIVSRGGGHEVIENCLAIDTNFELAHISRGYASARVVRNTLENIGTGDAVVNADGFVFGQIEGLTFEENRGENIERCLLKVSAHGGRIHRNELRGNNRRGGEMISAYPGIQVEECSALEISRNVLIDTGAGVSLSNDRIDDVEIFGNRIEQVNGTMGGGVVMSPGARGVVVRDNRIRDVPRHGIYAAGAIGDLEVLDNRIEGAGFAGVWLVSDGDFVSPVVRGNRIRDCLGGGGSGLLTLRRNSVGRFTDVAVAGNHVDATGLFENRAYWWLQDGDWITGRLEARDTVGRVVTHPDLVGLTVEK